MKPSPAGAWTRYLAPVCFLAFAAAFLVLTYQLPRAATAMPMLVGWATLVLATIDLVSRTGGKIGTFLMRSLNPAGLKPAAEAKAEAPAGLFPLLTGIGLVVLLVTLFLLVGVLVTAPIVIFTALMIANRREIVGNLAIAALATGVIWLLFSVLLRLHLYTGVVFGGVL